MDYERDDSTRVWMRPGFVGLAYSDGASSERYLLETMEKAERLDTFSEELHAAIRDWPSEYHLSRKRHCLLQPLAIRPGDSVLELGSGCGALSRYLGELGADVTAVEGSPTRATIGAARCRDLPNVRIYCDDLLQFHTDRRFDWVLMIGVLEYASMFAAEAGGAASYLSTVRRLLAPAGRLVLAIENKLGLKYFNGCSEDHVGQPFFGVQGLYKPPSAVTYGRRELHRLLEDAGFPTLEFLYPFPDYKLPSVVISDAAMRHPNFAAADLLFRDSSRDYSGAPYRLFDEALVAHELQSNGLLRDFSNSFLVVGSMASLPSTRAALAWTFAVGRREALCTQTVFEEEGNHVTVRKSRFVTAKPAAPPKGDEPFSHQVGVSRYAVGDLLVRRLLKAAARRESVAALCDLLDPWFRLLLERSQPSGKPDADARSLEGLVLPGVYLDCTPFNVVETSTGLAVIDDEWRTRQPVELGWIVVRSIYWTLFCPLAGGLKSQLGAIVEELAKRHDLVVAGESITTWMRAEADFQSWVQGHPVPVMPAIPDNQLRGLFDEVTGAGSQDLPAARIARLESDLGRYRSLLDRYDDAAIGASGTREKVERILLRMSGSSFRNSPDLPDGFRPLRYVLHYPDLLTAEVDPYEHYLAFGRREGRTWE